MKQRPIALRDDMDRPQRRAACPAAALPANRSPLFDKQFRNLVRHIEDADGPRADGLRAVTRIMLSSAARAGELTRSVWEDYDPDTGLFHGCREGRPLPLPTQAWQALAAFGGTPRLGAKAFPSSLALSSAFDAHARAVGIRGFRLCDLRSEAERRRADAPIIAAQSHELSRLPEGWRAQLRGLRQPGLPYGT